MALVVAAQSPPLLPQRLGAINDYGQTLERSDRQRLSELIERLSGQGVELVYLASWRDPFGDPSVYAREVFRAWGLGPRSILVVFLRPGRRWEAAGVLGEGVPISPEEFNRLLSRAARQANRAPPAHAVLNLVESLAGLVEGRVETASADRRAGAYVALGILLAGAAIWLVLRARLCPRYPPRAWWHRPSEPWWRIILLCPRSQGRGALGRGRGMGSRRGYLP